jgi:hypothetical protein
MSKYTANRTSVVLFEGKYYKLKKGKQLTELPKKLIDALLDSKSITKVAEPPKKRTYTRAKKEPVKGITVTDKHIIEEESNIDERKFTLFRKEDND